MAAARFPVEAGHVMMFARAIGDKNPIYYDADYARTTEPGAIIAPPTFVCAERQFDPDSLSRPKIGEPWVGSGKNASGPPRRQGKRDKGFGLHAEQHFTYYRHPQVGDVLKASVKPGRTWEKEGQRGGRLLFREVVTEFYDQNDERIVEARSVLVRTEKTPAQTKEGRSDDALEGA